MFARMTGAALRGALVAAMVMTPSFILPEYTSDAPEVSMLMALLAALLTFSEYRSDSPSFVEFRDAPPTTGSVSWRCSRWFW
ncbi:hypothetical protein ACFOHS_10045 [Jhaorihella thermophila]